MSNDFHSLLSVFRDATSSSSSTTGATAKSDGGNGKKVQSQKSDGTQKSSPAAASNNIDPTSTTDPSFSASTLKERIERILRIQQIRQSTSSNNVSDECIKNDGKRNNALHIAICATIVHDFPHEALWRKWMDETGGEITLENDTSSAQRKSDRNHAKIDGKVSESIGHDGTKTITSSAEMYVHAKNPERVRSEWLR